VNLRKVIQRTLRHSKDGVNVAGGLNAVVNANVNEPGESRTSVRSRTRIVQRNGRTEVFEQETQSNPEEGKE
jgi:hypothetical protein